MVYSGDQVKKKSIPELFGFAPGKCADMRSRHVRFHIIQIITLTNIYLLMGESKELMSLTVL